MPELPEVETVVRELNRKLKARVIKSVQVSAPKIVSVGPHILSPKRKAVQTKADEFVRLLEGKKIESVKRRAKLLIFDLSGKLSLLVHLKLTGQFIFEDEKLRKKTEGKYRTLNKLSAPLVQLPYKHTHVVFKFTDGATLYFNDVRKFGYLKIVRDDEIGQVTELGEYGPKPLSKEFTMLNFSTNVKKFNKRSIKQVLMDSQIVAGIGNIYSDEILFHAGVSPSRKGSSLKEEELKNIYKNIVPVLKKGILARGSSVGDFVRTDGSWGQMGKYHFVYGRKGQKCKVCGSTIQSAKLGGRTSSFCPKCQR